MSASDVKAPTSWGTAGRHGCPDYCPSDLDEGEVCPACGATPWLSENCACRARHNGPAPRPLLQIILTHRDTGEPI
jgi:hypothetical protein